MGNAVRSSFPQSGWRAAALVASVAFLFARPAPGEIISGSYIGNGDSNRPIVGVGFRPDIVIIKADAGERAVISTSTMPLGRTKEFISSNLAPNMIRSLDADGFTLDNHNNVNDNGPTYYWIAFKSVPGESKVGSYVGNGNDDRSIGGVGFRPDYVIVLPASSDPSFQRTSSMAAGLSADFDTAFNVSDHIQAMEADGFQVGQSDVNEAGTTYHYAAWTATPGKMSVGSYVGDGSDGRSITGVGLTPEYVIHRRNGGSPPHHKTRSTGAGVDRSLHFNNTANDTNNLQALQPNGFEVGSAPDVNASGDTYYWVAFGPAVNDAVQFFTVTSTSAQNFLEWLNPPIGTAYLATHVRYNRIPGSSACTFPGSVSAGTNLSVPPGSPGAHHTFTHGPVANDNTTYCYSAFVETQPGLVYSAGRFTRGRPFGLPFDTSPAPKWAFSTGATTMAPPGIGPAAYVTSNDRALYSMGRGPSPPAGRWPALFTPLALSEPAQSRLPVVPTTVIPGASQVAFLATQDGRVQAVDALVGGPLPLWSNPLPGTVLQAAPAGIFTSSGGAFDYVLIGTRNSSGGNIFYALRADDGTAWGAPFDNSALTGDATGGIGIISGGAAVDYAGRKVYFASRRLGGGSPNALWCLNLTPAGLTFAWALDLGEDVDGSPVLQGGRVYVGTNSGKVIGVDAADGGNPWTFATADGPVKGFVFPDRSGTGLYVSTTGKVWGLTDGVAAPNWPAVSITSPSIVLFRRNTTFVYVGSGDGRLYELDLVAATPSIPPTVKSVVLGDGLAGVGAPTLDTTHDLIYVGSEAGVVHAVSVPLP